MNFCITLTSIKTKKVHPQNYKLFFLTPLTVIPFFFLITNSYPQKVETVSVNFTRNTATDASSELVNGIIYFQASINKVILKVTDPVNQWMVFEGNTMLIYYPVEQKAFRFTSNNPLSLPFFDAFLGMMQDDFGLPSAGFKLDRHEMKEDTLLTYWEPPGGTKKLLGKTIIALVKDKIVFVEIQNSTGEKIAKTTYSNHIQFGLSFFPLEIITKKYHKNVPTIIKIKYDDPQFNTSLPQEVLNFKIPGDIEIAESQW